MNHIARLNVDGTLDVSFDPGSGADNNIMTANLQSDGKIIITGYFTAYDGVARNRIARINTDGSLDTSFNPGSGANEWIFSTAIQSDGKIIIGGGFTSYDGVARNRIARINTDGSLDVGFNVGAGANGPVSALALQSDGKIVVGGLFSSYNGTSKNNIIRIGSSGALDTEFLGSGANDQIYTIAIQSDGKIIIGGYFTSYSGTARSRIARINADGTLDAGFNNTALGANDNLRTSSIQSDGKIIIGGGFTSYNGVARNRIARINTDGSLDGSFNPGSGANALVVSSAIQSDAKIIISGVFTTYDGAARSYIARIGSDGTNESNFGDTQTQIPTVTTVSVTDINSVTATGNADLTATGGENPERFIQYSTISNSYNGTDQCSAGTGSTGTYSCALTDLVPDTTYYYRAKATNSAGEAYGAEQSFRTLPSEITVNDPTPDDLDSLLTDSYIVLDSGTLDATDQVTTHVDVTLATGSNQITLPDNTAITNTAGGTFDMSAFDITLRDVRSEVPDSLAAVKVGVPGTNLTFTNNPVAIDIYVGTQHNGKTMQVQYQNEGELTWNDHTTCVIASGLCSFTTTHATTYTVNGDGTISGETNINSSLPIEATISITCTDSIAMNPITGTGQSAIDAANEAICNVKTNNSQGYKLEWSAPQENLTNLNSDTINGYIPATPDTPELWAIDQATSAWGARLKSTSTDADTDTWGTSDGYAGKWLNVSTAPYQIVLRSTETLQTGSDETIQFGSEIGSNKFQPTGTYTGSVVMTATTL